MKYHFTIALLILSLFLILADLNHASNPIPVKGNKLPPIHLPLPKESKERDYLGLGSRSPFRISQIKAEVILIEIFSLYCPACIKMAPKIKELYETIESDPFLKNKIKIIGIGAGDSPREVKEFKRITEAPFPLFPDSDFTIHNALGEVRTPYFIAIKINPDRTLQVIYSEAGRFEVKEILDLIRTVSGLNKKD